MAQWQQIHLMSTKRIHLGLEWISIVLVMFSSLPSPSQRVGGKD